MIETLKNPPTRLPPKAWRARWAIVSLLILAPPPAPEAPAPVAEPAGPVSEASPPASTEDGKERPSDAVPVERTSDPPAAAADGAAAATTSPLAGEGREVTPRLQPALTGTSVATGSAQSVSSSPSGSSARKPASASPPPACAVPGILTSMSSSPFNVGGAAFVTSILAANAPAPPSAIGDDAARARSNAS